MLHAGLAGLLPAYILHPMDPKNRKKPCLRPNQDPKAYTHDTLKDGFGCFSGESTVGPSGLDAWDRALGEKQIYIYIYIYVYIYIYIYIYAKRT